MTTAFRGGIDFSEMKPISGSLTKIAFLRFVLFSYKFISPFEDLKVDKDVSSNEIFVSILGQNLYFILSQPTVAHIQLDRCARLRIRLLVVCRVSTDLAGPTNAGIAAVQFAFLINSTHQAFYCAYTETKAPQARATTAWRADGDEGFALVRFNCDFPTQLSHTKRVIAGQNRLSKR
jgi:hypothetical protein